MPDRSALVVGAGIAGLAAAVDLAASGVRTTVLERAAVPGGKLRALHVGGYAIDSGPTVLTMREVFDALFATAGTDLDSHLRLVPLEVLARHAWNAHERLDLHADMRRSIDAVAEFAGPREAERFRDFCSHARRAFHALDAAFLRRAEPGIVTLLRSGGLRGAAGLWALEPFSTLWDALGGRLHDPRLRQLFARYATYCGSSPFLAPATLVLITHVEQAGVWTVEGGLHQLAQALADASSRLGAAHRFDAEVIEMLVERDRVCGVRLSSGECLRADVVICAADVAALARGHFGLAVAKRAALRAPARSLSAMTWSLAAQPDGFPLAHHNVFFSEDYAREFRELFGSGEIPADPTVYVCAQARRTAVGSNGRVASATHGVEPLFALVNAPANGDDRRYDAASIEHAARGMRATLARCGMTLEATASVVTTPADFDRLYPGTGGALYGGACHGWKAAFQRPTARTRVPGLYVAGGSTHPGAGLPMAALSGRFAATSVLEDLGSTARFRQAGTRGGTSMRWTRKACGD